MPADCADRLSRNNFPENHDRYLIIDDKVEIILTSGFYYLNELNKEISYIVRLIDSHRF